MWRASLFLFLFLMSEFDLLSSQNSRFKGKTIAGNLRGQVKGTVDYLGSLTVKLLGLYSRNGSW